MWTFLPLKVNDELRAMTKSCESFDSAVMMSSEMPSAKYSCSASPLMLAKGSTAIDGLSGSGGTGFSGLPAAGAAASPERLPDLQRIDPDRLGDVLELRRAEIADREIEPRFHLTIGVLGQADRAGLGDALQSRGDIDAVAHQVAVALLDHVAEMDADPKFDALVRRDASVALDHRPLDLNGAVHRVDDAPELDNCAVAGALDDAAVMHGDGRIDQVASQRPQPRQNPVLVGSGKP